MSSRRRAPPARAARSTSATSSTARWSSSAVMTAPPARSSSSPCGRPRAARRRRAWAAGGPTPCDADRAEWYGRKQTNTARRKGRLMAFTTHLLVVANRTVDSPELLDALRLRAESGPIHVTMLAPSTSAERAEVQRRMERAAAHLDAAGVDSEAMVGDADPIVAVQEAWDPGRYDEVVVSTLAVGASRWLQIDLPHRVA